MPEVLFLINNTPVLIFFSHCDFLGGKFPKGEARREEASPLFLKCL